MTSKLVNKGSVMENSLKERVDRLIAKSNQGPSLNRGGNPDNRSYGRTPHMHNRSQGRFPNPNFQEPQGDIYQDL